MRLQATPAIGTLWPFPRTCEPACLGAGNPAQPGHRGMTSWCGGGRHDFLVACVVAGQLSKRGSQTQPWPSQRPAPLGRGCFQEVRGIHMCTMSSPQPPQSSGPCGQHALQIGTVSEPKSLNLMVPWFSQLGMGSCHHLL